MIDLVNSGVPRLIQRNLVAYMRLFANLPGVTIHDDADSFWIVCNREAPGNNVIYTHWQAFRADQDISSTLQAIGQHIHFIDWLVFPTDAPADLGSRLEALGMPGGPSGDWLWNDFSSVSPDASPPDNLRIQRVCDDAMLAEWVDVSEAGFGTDLTIYYDAYSRHGYGPEAQSVHYTGYLEGIPVTSATLLEAGGCAAIYDVSTLPEYRRRGYGAAITRYLLQEIRSRGYTGTWIWSSSMAAGVYRELGFVDADFGIRNHKWYRPGTH